MATLLDIARLHAEAHADRHGVAQTPVPGLAIIREIRPGALQFAVNKPLVALVLAGRKRVSLGAAAYEFGSGESLLILNDVPTVSQIVRASAGEPYLSVVVDLDPVTIEELVAELKAAPAAPAAPVRVDQTEGEVEDVVLRLLRLLDRPAALRALHKPLMRELHYWLLSGRHGAAIQSLGSAGSHARRIGRSVALIRANYAVPLRVDDMAKAAGMSVSAFHTHFRAVTSLTPLQLQKQLRLIEARRLLHAEGATIGQAAHAVGYESVPQFTRDYGRLFGAPPARDLRAARVRVASAA